jgi:hypothetical protein
LDNASNNATFLLHLSILLQEIGVHDFDEKQNYICCFSHVINLCSQVVIRVMEKDDVDADYSDSETDPATESSTGSDPGPRATRYTRKAGPIRWARKTVAFVHKSGQRRDELQAIIEQGNTDSIWREITVGENNTPIETTVNLGISQPIFL